MPGSMVTVAPDRQYFGRQAAQARGFMDLQANTMAGAMTEILAVSRRGDDIAHQAIRLTSGHPGMNFASAGGLRLITDAVQLVGRGRDFRDREGARHIRTVMPVARSHIHHHQVAGAQRTRTGPAHAEVRYVPRRPR